jgi:membrane fusion protein (multidrug efflux system)
VNPKLHLPRPGVLASLAPLVLAACGQQAAPPAFTPPEAVVQRIEARTIPVDWEFLGQTESSHQVEIRTRVQGFLDRRLYDEGSLVRKNQVLFQLDDRPFAAALQRQKGTLAQAEVRRDNARRNLERLKNLVAEKAVSQKDVDDATFSLKDAEAAVQAAKAAVTTEELNLSYATIRSPLTGLAGRAKKDEGSLVSPGADDLLTTVVQTDPMRVNFSVSDTRLLKVREAMAKKQLVAPAHNNYVVELRLADGSAYPSPGKVNFSDTLIAAETGTVGIRAVFPNPDFLLRPGQFVRVRLKGITRPDALLVPQRAVQQGQQGKYLYVVDADGKAEMRPVEVGDWYGDDWLIESGLKSGEQVVVDGVGRVIPGMPVKAVQSSSAGPDASRS